LDGRLETVIHRPPDADCPGIAPSSLPDPGHRPYCGKLLDLVQQGLTHAFRGRTRVGRPLATFLLLSKPGGAAPHEVGLDLVSRFYILTSADHVLRRVFVPPELHVRARHAGLIPRDAA
jgi:hypothetical protein